MAFCKNCGSNIDDNAVVCPKCGVATDKMTEKKRGAGGLSIASLVLGIVAVAFNCCFYYISIPCSIVGLCLGIAGVKKDHSGVGKAGIVLSIISIVFTILCMTVLAAFYSSLLSSLGV